jgi:hypothetical protein
MTVLFSTRALKPEVKPKIDTIIDSPYRESLEWDSTLAVDFWKHLGYTPMKWIPRALKWHRFHFTTKSGPNGSTALNTSIRDFFSLPYKAREAIKVMGGVKLQSWMESAFSNEGRSILAGIYNTSFGRFRKLVYFPDKEAKSRVVAILDYFSQTVLRPLHLYLFRALKKIPQDVTFDQSKFKELIKDWEYFHSVDLSAATDRFPALFISEVLRGILPKDYVDSWEVLMLRYPFDISLGKGKKAMKLKYAVGNPMGAYSSWASFAITHHYIFYQISRELNEDYSKLKYILLGDDILIGDPRVSDLYLSKINNLGVEVSLMKTHRSLTTCEFAKRWIHKGNEISPFPVSSLKESSKRYFLLTNLLLQEELKGWNWVHGVPSMVGDFYGRFFNRPSRYRKEIVKKVTILEQMMKIIWGSVEANDGINNIVRFLGLRLPLITGNVGNSLISNIMVELFSNSNPESAQNVGKGKPLGLLAEQIVMYLTSFEDPLAFTLLDNPLLHAAGSVEQSYLDLRKEAGAIGKEDWPHYLRNMTIPLSDEVFVKRASAVDSKAASVVVKSLVERLEILVQFPQLLSM